MERINRARLGGSSDAILACTLICCNDTDAYFVASSKAVTDAPNLQEGSRSSAVDGAVLAPLLEV